jgi:DNA-binding NarL/FixJ family response regulator
MDVNGDELVGAIRAVEAGLVVVPSAVSAELLTLARPVAAYAPANANAGVTLTPREREVLALLAQGLANKVIAPRLGISEHTVKTHVAAVYEKLHARNRAEAVVAAARQGLLLL